MIKGRIFSVAGLSPETRDQAKQIIYANGGKALMPISDSTEVLVYDEDYKPSKLSAAMDQGLETWSMDELIANADAVKVQPPAMPDQLPQTREEAITLIALLQKQFDIEPDDDMYTNAIEAMEARYQSHVSEIVNQAMGVAIKAAKRKFLVVDPAILIDSKPYHVSVTDLPNGTCRYQLVGYK